MAPSWDSAGYLTRPILLITVATKAAVGVVRKLKGTA
jgi:hypothetical protein